MLPTQRISCMRLLVTCTHESYISVFKSSSFQMQQSQWHKPVCILRLAQFNVQWPGCENDEWNSSLDLVIQFVTSQWVASFLTPSLPDDVCIRRRASVPRVPCMTYIYVLYTLVLYKPWHCRKRYWRWHPGTTGHQPCCWLLFGLLLCASLQCYIETGQCVT